MWLRIINECQVRLKPNTHYLITDKKDSINAHLQTLIFTRTYLKICNIKTNETITLSFVDGIIKSSNRKRDPSKLKKYLYKYLNYVLKRINNNQNEIKIEKETQTTTNTQPPTNTLNTLHIKKLSEEDLEKITGGAVIGGLRLAPSPPQTHETKTVSATDMVSENETKKTEEDLVALIGLVKKELYDRHPPEYFLKTVVSSQESGVSTKFDMHVGTKLKQDLLDTCTEKIKEYAKQTSISTRQMVLNIQNQLRSSSDQEPKEEDIMTALNTALQRITEGSPPPTEQEKLNRLKKELALKGTKPLDEWLKTEQTKLEINNSLHKAPDIKILTASKLALKDNAEATEILKMMEKVDKDTITSITKRVDEFMKKKTHSTKDKGSLLSCYQRLTSIDTSMKEHYLDIKSHLHLADTKRVLDANKAQQKEITLKLKTATRKQKNHLETELKKLKEELKDIKKSRTTTFTGVKLEVFKAEIATYKKLRHQEAPNSDLAQLKGIFGDENVTATPNNKHEFTVSIGSKKFKLTKQKPTDTRKIQDETKLDQQIKKDQATLETQAKEIFAECTEKQKVSMQQHLMFQHCDLGTTEKKFLQEVNRLGEKMKNGGTLDAQDIQSLQSEKDQLMEISKDHSQLIEEQMTALFSVIKDYTPKIKLENATFSSITRAKYGNKQTVLTRINDTLDIYTDILTAEQMTELCDHCLEGDDNTLKKVLEDVFRKEGSKSKEIAETILKKITQKFSQESSHELKESLAKELSPEKFETSLEKMDLSLFDKLLPDGHTTPTYQRILACIVTSTSDLDTHLEKAILQQIKGRKPTSNMSVAEEPSTSSVKQLAMRAIRRANVPIDATPVQLDNKDYKDELKQEIKDLSKYLSKIIQQPVDLNTVNQSTVHGTLEQCIEQSSLKAALEGIKLTNQTASQKFRIAYLEHCFAQTASIETELGNYDKHCAKLEITTELSPSKTKATKSWLENQDAKTLVSILDINSSNATDIINALKTPNTEALKNLLRINKEYSELGEVITDNPDLKSILIIQLLLEDQKCQKLICQKAITILLKELNKETSQEEASALKTQIQVLINHDLLSTSEVLDIFKDSTDKITLNRTQGKARFTNKTEALTQINTILDKYEGLLTTEGNPLLTADQMEELCDQCLEGGTVKEILQASFRPGESNSKETAKTVLSRMFLTGITFAKCKELTPSIKAEQKDQTGEVEYSNKTEILNYLNEIAERFKDHLSPSDIQTLCTECLEGANLTEILRQSSKESSNAYAANNTLSDTLGIASSSSTSDTELTDIQSLLKQLKDPTLSEPNRADILNKIKDLHLSDTELLASCKELETQKMKIKDGKGKREALTFINTLVDRYKSILDPQQIKTLCEHCLEGATLEQLLADAFNPNESHSKEIAEEFLTKMKEAGKKFSFEECTELTPSITAKQKDQTGNIKYTNKRDILNYLNKIAERFKDHLSPSDIQTLCNQCLEGADLTEILRQSSKESSKAYDAANKLSRTLGITSSSSTSDTEPADIQSLLKQLKDPNLSEPARDAITTRILDLEFSEDTLLASCEELETQKMLIKDGKGKREALTFINTLVDRYQSILAPPQIETLCEHCLQGATLKELLTDALNPNKESHSKKIAEELLTKMKKAGKIFSFKECKELTPSIKVKTNKRGQIKYSNKTQIFHYLNSVLDRFKEQLTTAQMEQLINECLNGVSLDDIYKEALRDKSNSKAEAETCLSKMITLKIKNRTPLTYVECQYIDGNETLKQSLIACISEEIKAYTQNSKRKTTTFKVLNSGINDLESILDDYIISRALKKEICAHFLTEWADNLHNAEITSLSVKDTLQNTVTLLKEHPEFAEVRCLKEASVKAQAHFNALQLLVKSREGQAIQASLISTGIEFKEFISFLQKQTPLEEVFKLIPGIDETIKSHITTFNEALKKIELFEAAIDLISDPLTKEILGHCLGLDIEEREDTSRVKGENATGAALSSIVFTAMVPDNGRIQSLEYGQRVASVLEGTRAQGEVLASGELPAFYEIILDVNDLEGLKPKLLRELNAIVSISKKLTPAEEEQLEAIQTMMYTEEADEGKIIEALTTFHTSVKASLKIQFNQEWPFIKKQLNLSQELDFQTFLDNLPMQDIGSTYVQLKEATEQSMKGTNTWEKSIKLQSQLYDIHSITEQIKDTQAQQPSTTTKTATALKEELTIRKEAIRTQFMHLPPQEQLKIYLHSNKDVQGIITTDMNPELPTLKSINNIKLKLNRSHKQQRQKSLQTKLQKNIQAFKNEFEKLTIEDQLKIYMQCSETERAIITTDMNPELDTNCPITGKKYKEIQQPVIWNGKIYETSALLKSIAIAITDTNTNPVGPLRKTITRPELQKLWDDYTRLDHAGDETSLSEAERMQIEKWLNEEELSPLSRPDTSEDEAIAKQLKALQEEASTTPPTNTEKITKLEENTSLLVKQLDNEAITQAFEKISKSHKALQDFIQSNIWQEATSSTASTKTKPETMTPPSQKEISTN